VHAPLEQVVQPSPQANEAEQQLVREGPVAGLQPVRDPSERDVEAESPPYVRQHAEHRLPGWERPAPSGWTPQSSIPEVGEDGTAISRAGMRPAR